MCIEMVSAAGNDESSNHLVGGPFAREADVKIVAGDRWGPAGGIDIGSVAEREDAKRSAEMGAVEGGRFSFAKAAFLRRSRTRLLPESSNPSGKFRTNAKSSMAAAAA